MASRFFANALLLVACLATASHLALAATVKVSTYDELKKASATEGTKILVLKNIAFPPRASAIAVADMVFITSHNAAKPVTINAKGALNIFTYHAGVYVTSLVLTGAKSAALAITSTRALGANVEEVTFKGNAASIDFPTAGLLHILKCTFSDPKLFTKDKFYGYDATITNSTFTSKVKILAGVKFTSPALTGEVQVCPLNFNVQAGKGVSFCPTSEVTVKSYGELEMAAQSEGVQVIDIGGNIAFPANAQPIYLQDYTMVKSAGRKPAVVDAKGTSYIFTYHAGVSVSNLVLQGAKTAAVGIFSTRAGGAILDHVTFRNNSASIDFNEGLLSALSCKFSDKQVFTSDLFYGWSGALSSCTFTHKVKINAGIYFDFLGFDGSLVICPKNPNVIAGKNVTQAAKCQ